MLDDVESELDSSRKEALFRLVKENKSQVIITSTELSERFDKALGNAQKLEISAGTIG